MTQTTAPNLIDVLVTDHRELETLFAELETGHGGPEHRRRLADVVIAELVRHAVAEEIYLYPTARRVLPDGDQLAERELGEHAAAERLMKDLEGLDATAPEFDTTLATLTGLVRHHVRDEESDLLPRLRHACDLAELRELGLKATAAKKFAPTRPHPAAPQRPPLNRAVAAGTGLVDRLRDALSGRATSPRDV
jgi:hemerythrin superfamily protein